jgi:hypothetical protein
MAASRNLWRPLSWMAVGKYAMITFAGPAVGPAMGQQAAQPRLLVNPIQIGIYDGAGGVSHGHH